MMKLITTLILIFAHAAPQNDCAQALRIDGTSGFVAYLAHLVEQRQIGTRELEALISGIESRNEVPNVIPHEQTRAGNLFTNPAHQIHFGELQEYIANARLDHAKILAWAKSWLGETGRIKEKRAEVRAATNAIHQEMEFHRVLNGAFKFGKGRVPVTLAHPFEVMSTPVTQKMWMDLMGKNPSKFKGPDNPVESMTWYSALVFANRLSESRGLKAVYDLSDVVFEPGTSAEAGTLSAVSGEMKTHGGDVYESEGYRLPTQWEQQYLLSDRGRSTTHYFTGVDDSNFGHYAWYKENARGRTHPVAELAPLMIDEKEFYDLLGNVMELSNDKMSEKWSNNHYAKMGGSWEDFPGCSHWFEEYFFDENDREPTTGFRLVRTVN